MKRSNKNLFHLAFIFFAALLIISGCSDSTASDSDSTPSKIEQGLVPRDNSAVYSDLSVTAESIVENYDVLDSTTIKNDDIEITRIQDVTDTEGNEYINNFRITGVFPSNGENYTFSTMISFNEDDLDSSFSVLFYQSSRSGKLIDVKMK